MASTDPLNVSLEGSLARFEQATRSVLAAFAQAQIPTGNQVTPAMLMDGVRQMFAVMQKLDAAESWDPALPEDDPEQLGDYAIGFLMDLSTWADRLHERQSKQAFDVAAVGAAAWVIRHGGRLRTLEPVVNGLAALANANQEPETLLRVAQLMEQVIRAAQDNFAADLDQADPGRPWRILLLNHGISATRAQDPAQMEKAFQLILEHLPQDAPAFFDEGLRQVSQGGFPPALVEIMRTYQQKAAGAMH